MAWDDFGFDSGSGSDFGSFDAFSGGSWSPQDYDFGNNFSAPQAPMSAQSFGQQGLPFMGSLVQQDSNAPQQGDIQSGTGMQYDPISNGWSNSQGEQASMPQAPQQQGNWFSNMFGGGGANAGGGIPQPQGAMNVQLQQGGGAGGWMGALPGLLGAGGGLASVIGQMVGGGQGPQQQRTLNNAGQGALNSANSMNAIGATGQLPAQQMQMSLLQALQSGQGLPPAYQQLIEQSFQPQMGDLYTQAAQMGQKRGFHDAPATSPPGGAILGPGLANLQGQMASEKLKMMMGMPGVFMGAMNITTMLGSLISWPMFWPRKL